MSSRFSNNLLAQLEARRYRVDPGETARILKILSSLGAARFPAAPSLIRFHECLLFLRAFPQGPHVVRKTDTLLNNFHERVEALRKSGARGKTRMGSDKSPSWKPRGDGR
jgi:hypothetical protein